MCFYLIGLITVSCLCQQNLSDLEMYASYEYNDTCEQDSTEEVLIGSVVLPAVYYVLFCFGVLGVLYILPIMPTYI